MYKVLIADDESLARIGLQTMIANIYGNDVEIVGAAQDGQEALTIMEQSFPDVIISDIKMPVMSGLELAKYVDETFQEKPLFIFLTSYEDFNFAREALKCRAYDYLIKMEFGRDVLKRVLDKAFAEVDEERSRKKTQGTEEENFSNVFVSRFYYSLLSGGFHSEEQILEAAESCDQKVKAESYLVAAIRLHYPEGLDLVSSSRFNLYFSILNSVKMALSMHFRCHITAYNHVTLGALIMLDEKTEEKEQWEEAFRETARLCRQYFNVGLYCGIGKQIDSLQDTAVSFGMAQKMLEITGEEQPIVFYQMKCQGEEGEMGKAVPVSISSINRVLVQSLEHCGVELFRHTIEQLMELMKLEGMESCINLISGVVHLIINCLEDGEKVMKEAFQNQKLNYQVLYSLKSKDELNRYLEQLSASVTDIMKKQLDDPKYKLVLNAKEYIKNHIYDRLTLGEVANAIGISQNYLSALFKIYSSPGFADYVAGLKIKTAQNMLKKEHLKIYQVSERLGFDSPQYFSKVYKKYTGYSPSEMVAQAESQEPDIS